MNKIFVREVRNKITNPLTVLENDNIEYIADKFLSSPINRTIYVVDNNSKFLGYITVKNFLKIILLDMIDYSVYKDISQEAYIYGKLGNISKAKDIMIEHGFPIFKPDESLANVMKRLSCHIYEAPVVHNGEIVGSIWPDDLITQYNTELFKRDMVSGMVSSINTTTQQTSIPGVSNLQLAEIAIPYRFVGHTIADLNIRKRLDVTILIIKRKVHGEDKLVDTIPTADTEFKTGDVVLVMGPKPGLAKFERG